MKIAETKEFHKLKLIALLKQGLTTSEVFSLILDLTQTIEDYYNFLNLLFEYHYSVAQIKKIYENCNFSKFIDWQYIEPVFKINNKNNDSIAVYKNFYASFENCTDEKTLARVNFFIAKILLQNNKNLKDDDLLKSCIDGCNKYKNIDVEMLDFYLMLY